MALLAVASIAREAKFRRNMNVGLMEQLAVARLVGSSFSVFGKKKRSIYFLSKTFELF